MNRVRWRIAFMTQQEKKAYIYIYENNYTGDVIDVEAASVPFVTEEDNGDELLLPLRSQTGYIRLIDEGNLDDLMPSDNLQHYTELHIDNNLEWCGYMEATTYTRNWEAAPSEIECPIKSGLGVLDSLYLDQHTDFGDRTLAALLHECISLNRIAYQYIYIPAEALSQTGNYPALLKMSCSRYNFFQETESEITDVDYQKYESWTAQEVIAEICKFFGWTLYERGLDLYVVSRSDCNYFRMDFATFATSVSVTPASYDIHNLYDLDFDGDGHTKCVIKGSSIFKVISDFNSVGDVVPLIDKDSLGQRGILNVAYTGGYSQEPLRYEQIKLYGPGSVNHNTEMFQYKFTDATGDLDKMERMPFDEKEYHKRVGSCVGDYDLYEASSLAEKKNYNYKSAVIMQSISGRNRYVGRELYQYPFFIMRNPRCVRYNEGAFVVKANTILVYGLNTDNKQDIHQEYELNVLLKIGNKYWNGDSFSTEKSYFKIKVDAQGKVVSTKTLSMPYNGADGYVIELKEAVYGDIEMIFYWISGNNLPLVDRVYIENLKVEYYGDDNHVSDTAKTTNIYQTKIDSAYQNKVEIDLKLATNNQNVAGYGLLTIDGKYVEKLVYPCGLKRPEEFLLGKLKQVYGRNVESLTIEVKRGKYLPFDVFQDEGKTYALISTATNWIDERDTLTLMTIE